MIIFISLALLIGAVVCVGLLTDWIGCEVISIILSAVLVLAIIFLPISYYGYRAEMQEYKLFVLTYMSIDEANVSSAGAVLERMRWNQRLANIKYWNDSIFDIYIPDDFANCPYVP